MSFGTFEGQRRNYIITDLMVNANAMDSMYPSLTLKTPDTIGNCQRLVFSLDVTQHARNKPVNNLSSINWSSKLRDNNEIRKKNTLVTPSCVRYDG